VKTVTRAFLRYLRRRRSLALLQVLGIACGVAAVIGMVFSARAALHSFSRAIAFLNGEATHSMERVAGPIDERVLRRLAEDLAVRAFSPVIQRKLRLSTGEAVRILGIDPFLDRAMRPRMRYFAHGGAGRDDETRQMLSFLDDPRGILLDRETASRLGLEPGDKVATSRGTRALIATFASPSPEPLIVMDIGNAQMALRPEGDDRPRRPHSG
jgi:putative ABC transport system permease protein